MELNTNNFSDHSNSTVNGAKDELKILGSDLTGQTTIEGHRKTMLTRHVKDLRTSHQTWVSRLLLPKGEKEMLKIFDEKELEGIRIVLDGQNDALRVICASHVSFIKEVVNTMLKTGRSGLQSAASVIFKENALTMQTNLTRISNQFYNLLEAKYYDAEKRQPFVQKQIMNEIDIMIAKWNQDFMILQDDFSKILNEKV